MKRLLILPEDFAVKLKECRPGLLKYKTEIYFKNVDGTIYDRDGLIVVYLELDLSQELNEELEVIPVFADWRDLE